MKVADEVRAIQSPCVQNGSKTVSLKGTVVKIIPAGDLLTNTDLFVYCNLRLCDPEYIPAKGENSYVERYVIKLSSAAHDYIIVPKNSLWTYTVLRSQNPLVIRALADKESMIEGTVGIIENEIYKVDSVQHGVLYIKTGEHSVMTLSEDEFEIIQYENGNYRLRYIERLEFLASSTYGLIHRVNRNHSETLKFNTEEEGLKFLNDAVAYGENHYRVIEVM